MPEGGATDTSPAVRRISVVGNAILATTATTAAANVPKIYKIKIGLMWA